MLFLFKSTHDVIKAEKCCHKNSITCKIIPIPRSISTDCGMGIEVDQERAETVVCLLKKNNITYKTHNQYKK